MSVAAATASSVRRRLRVLVIDDSALVRQIMTMILPKGEIDVTVAADPLIATRKIAQDRPDVILLDLEMPRMDGLTFLQQQMARDPIPVVVCSSLGARGSQSALRALEQGAVEVVAKPQVGIRDFLQESSTILIDAVWAAAGARRTRSPRPVKRPAPPQPLPPPARREPHQANGRTIVAVGASTGGTEALRELLEGLPADAPGLVIVQHMPAGFTTAFAAWLDKLCRLHVREARDGDAVVPGQALIAPGDHHLSVRRQGSGYAVRVAHGPLVSRHRPSVNVLFRSVARAAGADGIGVIMTGMGDDGADGLLEMHNAGAHTLAQDEASCVVFGMPKEAITLGAVDNVVPLDGLAQSILRRSAVVAPTLKRREDRGAQ